MRPDQKKQILWQGIYASKDEIRSSMNNKDNYASWHIPDKIAEVRKLLNRLNPQDPETYYTGDRSLFPLIVSLVIRNKPSITILDIGGGLGLDYIGLLICCRTSTKISYNIIEIPEIYAESEKILNECYPGNPDIHFIHDLMDCPAPDIILFNSSLQYFDDPMEKVREAAALKPDCLVFIRLSAGYFPQYLTKQVNISDNNVPYWFVNIDEMNNILSCHEYDLIYKSRGDSEYYQENFPESYRMGRTWNLIFMRSDIIE